MAKTNRVCSIEGCDKAVLAKDWCRAHYKRWHRHGDPLGGRTARGDPLAFLEKTVLTFDGDECLIWPFGVSSYGYGKIWINSKPYTASRIVCEHEHGPPPTPKHQAAHKCGKGHEGCVNRKHLEWKTPKENEADKLIHGTINRGERNCSAKLTEAQVREIRAAVGLHRDIAAKYGVSRGTVCDIINRRMWAHVE